MSLKAYAASIAYEYVTEELEPDFRGVSMENLPGCCRRWSENMFRIVMRTISNDMETKKDPRLIKLYEAINDENSCENVHGYLIDAIMQSIDRRLHDELNAWFSPPYNPYSRK